MFSALLWASCSDIDKQEYAGGAISGEQSQQTNEAIPSRTKAKFEGMFTLLGNPCHNYLTHFSSLRPDDFGFVMSAISLDLEGADMAMQDNGYNWFSPASELSTRNANYAIPYARYVIPYTAIGTANESIEDIIKLFGADTQDADALNMIAQAKAIRAFSYLALAPYFQGNYQTCKDKPCVPLQDDKNDNNNNPRATVAEVYDAIIEDLTWAIEHLTEVRSDKAHINKNVACGLRARAYLYMGEYAKALADAEEAMKGYTPASIADVSVPGFDDSAAANWIWTYDLADYQIVSASYGYATAASWLSALSGDGYAPATQNIPVINKLLYDKIPATDVRKGWWLNKDLHSPLLKNLVWRDSKGEVLAKGDAIAPLKIANVKEPMLPYTNVKFGMKSGVGSQKNNSSFPLMRVEEMILIKAECLAKTNQEGEAKNVLTNFVKTYRDPSYTIPTSRSLMDEIWFQRRVELWGEGFFTADARRLGKDIVRFHGKDTSNFPDAFTFNIKNDDGWLNLRFPQSEMNTNKGIVDNTEGSQPVAGQNPDLRDGVTD